jgi:hypothetical protein
MSSIQFLILQPRIDYQETFAYLKNSKEMSFGCFYSSVIRKQKDLLGKHSRLSSRAFEHVLDPNKYCHLKTLAFLAHMVESQTVGSDHHQEIEFLTFDFDKKFISIYDVRSLLTLSDSYVRFFQGSIRCVCRPLTASFP